VDYRVPCLFGHEEQVQEDQSADHIGIKCESSKSVERQRITNIGRFMLCLSNRGKL
jgi:hypothetical protein